MESSTGIPGRLPVVGVMGSGSTDWTERAEALGRALARLEVHLLTGGGSGVMRSVSRAFASVPDRRGLVVGVLPGMPTSRGDVIAPPGYPNEGVELVIRTHLHARGGAGDAADSRNHINVLSSDVVIALPGGPGTASEVRLALRYGRPVWAHLEHRGQIPDLPDAAPVLGDLPALLERLGRELDGIRG